MGSYWSKAATKGNKAVPARGKAQTTARMAGEWENPRATLRGSGAGPSSPPSPPPEPPPQSGRALAGPPSARPPWTAPFWHHPSPMVLTGSPSTKPAPPAHRSPSVPPSGPLQEESGGPRAGLFRPHTHSALLLPLQAKPLIQEPLLRWTPPPPPLIHPLPLLLASHLLLTMVD